MCLEGKDPKPCTATRRKQRVILMGESLLQGTEAPLCQPGLSCREVCCLPGAQVWDVVEGLLKLTWPSAYYPLLLFLVGTNDTARGNLESIKSDYRALRKGSEGPGGPGGVVLNPAGEGKGCEEEGTDNAGQYLAVELELVAGF